MPNPARSMGVSPTRGLTTEPVKVLIGDCCTAQYSFVRWREPACKKVDSNSYALNADLFEIAGGLVSEHDAEFMDTLWHCTSGTWPE